MQKILQGKTALVMGSASSDRETMNLIEENGGNAIFLEADTLQAGEISSRIERISSEFRHLDLACNFTRTVGNPGLTADFSEDDWNRVVNMNLKGMWLAMKYEIRHMLKQRAGAIVNILSNEGLNGARASSFDSISAHALAGLTKSAALEYAKMGIRINAVSVDMELSGSDFISLPLTAFGTAKRPSPPRKRGSSLLDSRFRRADRTVPDDQAPDRRLANRRGNDMVTCVARTVIWLCSDAASFVTGQVITVGEHRIST